MWFCPFGRYIDRITQLSAGVWSLSPSRLLNKSHPKSKYSAPQNGVTSLDTNYLVFFLCFLIGLPSIAVDSSDSIVYHSIDDGIARLSRSFHNVLITYLFHRLHCPLFATSWGEAGARFSRPARFAPSISLENQANRFFFQLFYSTHSTITHNMYQL